MFAGTASLSETFEASDGLAELFAGPGMDPTDPTGSRHWRHSGRCWTRSRLQVMVLMLDPFASPERALIAMLNVAVAADARFAGALASPPRLSYP